MNLYFCDWAGIGSEVGSEPVHRRGMHRRKDNTQRGLFHTEAGNEPGSAGGTKRAQVRNHSPHTVGIFQPAFGPPDAVRGLKAAEDEH